MEDQVGKELYFSREIGLPAKGLDPSKDCHHVSDEELLYIFGEKTGYKGYSYDDAKFEKVRTRVYKLFPAIWQTQVMPAHSRICESFARAVVSEVCHNNPMNWARYAADRWKGKTIESCDEPVIYYEEDDTGDRYYDLVLERYSRELEQASIDHQNACNAHRRALETLIANRRPLGEAQVKKLAEELKSLQNVLESSEHLVEEMKREMESLSGSSDDQAQRVWLENEIKCELNGISALKTNIGRKVSRLGVSEEDKQKAIEEEKSLRLAEEAQKFEMERVQHYLRTLEVKCPTPVIRSPSPAVGPTEPEPVPQPDIDTTKLRACALCGSGFPELNIIISPCLCGYHPWCAAVHTSLDDTCAGKVCKAKFPDFWLKSFGFAKVLSDTMPDGTLVVVTPGSTERRRSHLNSDVGGGNYTGRKERSPASSRKRVKKKE